MRLAKTILALLLLVLLIGIAAMLRERFSGPVIGAARAIDGDSLRVGDTEIRLSGLDAPEFDQSCGAIADQTPCGLNAKRFLQSLLENGLLRCDIEGPDKYDRSLAQCWLGEKDIGEALVRAGHAVATDGYFGAQEAARRAKAGIWAGPFEMPSDWRKRAKP
jgi:endonuclease YncB( thermonuclease family)